MEAGDNQPSSAASWSTSSSSLASSWTNGSVYSKNSDQPQSSSGGPRDHELSGQNDDVQTRRERRTSRCDDFVSSCSTASGTSKGSISEDIAEIHTCSTHSSNYTFRSTQGGRQSSASGTTVRMTETAFSDETAACPVVGTQEQGALTPLRGIIAAIPPAVDVMGDVTLANDPLEKLTCTVDLPSAFIRQKDDAVGEKAPETLYPGGGQKISEGHCGGSGEHISLKARELAGIKGGSVGPHMRCVVTCPAFETRSRRPGGEWGHESTTGVRKGKVKKISRQVSRYASESSGCNGGFDVVCERRKTKRRSRPRERGHKRSPPKHKRRIASTTDVLDAVHEAVDDLVDEFRPLESTANESYPPPLEPERSLSARASHEQLEKVRTICNLLESITEDMKNETWNKKTKPVVVDLRDRKRGAGVKRRKKKSVASSEEKRVKRKSRKGSSKPKKSSSSKARATSSLEMEIAVEDEHIEEIEGEEPEEDRQEYMYYDIEGNDKKVRFRGNLVLDSNVSSVIELSTTPTDTVVEVTQSEATSPRRKENKRRFRKPASGWSSGSSDIPDIVVETVQYEERRRSESEDGVVDIAGKKSKRDKRNKGFGKEQREESVTESEDTQDIDKRSGRSKSRQDETKRKVKPSKGEGRGKDDSEAIKRSKRDVGEGISRVEHRRDGSRKGESDHREMGRRQDKRPEEQSSRTQANERNEHEEHWRQASDDRRGLGNDIKNGVRHAEADVSFGSRESSCERHLNDDGKHQRDASHDLGGRQISSEYTRDIDSRGKKYTMDIHVDSRGKKPLTGHRSVEGEYWSREPSFEYRREVEYDSRRKEPSREYRRGKSGDSRESQGPTRHTDDAEASGRGSSCDSRRETKSDFGARSHSECLRDVKDDFRDFPRRPEPGRRDGAGYKDKQSSREQKRDTGALRDRDPSLEPRREDNVRDLRRSVERRNDVERASNVLEFSFGHSRSYSNENQDWEHQVCHKGKTGNDFSKQSSREQKRETGALRDRDSSLERRREDNVRDHGRTAERHKDAKRTANVLQFSFEQSRSYSNESQDREHQLCHKGKTGQDFSKRLSKEQKKDTGGFRDIDPLLEPRREDNVRAHGRSGERQNNVEQTSNVLEFSFLHNRSSSNENRDWEHNLCHKGKTGKDFSKQSPKEQKKDTGGFRDIDASFEPQREDSVMAHGRSVERRNDVERASNVLEFSFLHSKSSNNESQDWEHQLCHDRKTGKDFGKRESSSKFCKSADADFTSTHLLPRYGAEADVATERKEPPFECRRGPKGEIVIDLKRRKSSPKRQKDVEEACKGGQHGPGHRKDHDFVGTQPSVEDKRGVIGDIPSRHHPPVSKIREIERDITVMDHSPERRKNAGSLSEGLRILAHNKDGAVVGKRQSTVERKKNIEDEFLSKQHSFEFLRKVINNEHLSGRERTFQESTLESQHTPKIKKDHEQDLNKGKPSVGHGRDVGEELKGRQFSFQLRREMNSSNVKPSPEHQGKVETSKGGQRTPDYGRPEERASSVRQPSLDHVKGTEGDSRGREAESTHRTDTRRDLSHDHRQATGGDLNRRDSHLADRDGHHPHPNKDVPHESRGKEELGGMHVSGQGQSAQEVCKERDSPSQECLTAEIQLTRWASSRDQWGAAEGSSVQSSHSSFDHHLCGPGPFRSQSPRQKTAEAKRETTTKEHPPTPRPGSHVVPTERRHAQEGGVAVEHAPAKSEKPYEKTTRPPCQRRDGENEQQYPQVGILTAELNLSRQFFYGSDFENPPPYVTDLRSPSRSVSSTGSRSAASKDGGRPSRTGAVSDVPSGARRKESDISTGSGETLQRVSSGSQLDHGVRSPSLRDLRLKREVVSGAAEGRQTPTEVGSVSSTGSEINMAVGKVEHVRRVTEVPPVFHSDKRREKKKAADTQGHNIIIRISSDRDDPRKVVPETPHVDAKRKASPRKEIEYDTGSKKRVAAKQKEVQKETKERKARPESEKSNRETKQNVALSPSSVYQECKSNLMDDPFFNPVTSGPRINVWHIPKEDLRRHLEAMIPRDTEPKLSRSKHSKRKRSPSEKVRSRRSRSSRPVSKLNANRDFDANSECRDRKKSAYEIEDPVFDIEVTRRSTRGRSRSNEQNPIASEPEPPLPGRASSTRDTIRDLKGSIQHQDGRETLFTAGEEPVQDNEGMGFDFEQHASREMMQLEHQPFPSPEFVTGPLLSVPLLPEAGSGTQYVGRQGEQRRRRLSPRRCPPWAVDMQRTVQGSPGMPQSVGLFDVPGMPMLQRMVVRGFRGHQPIMVSRIPGQEPYFALEGAHATPGGQSRRGAFIRRSPTPGDNRTLHASSRAEGSQLGNQQMLEMAHSLQPLSAQQFASQPRCLSPGRSQKASGWQTSPLGEPQQRKPNESEFCTTLFHRDLRYGVPSNHQPISPVTRIFTARTSTADDPCPMSQSRPMEVHTVPTCHRPTLDHKKPEPYRELGRTSPFAGLKRIVRSSLSQPILSSSMATNSHASRPSVTALEMVNAPKMEPIPEGTQVPASPPARAARKKITLSASTSSRNTSGTEEEGARSPTVSSWHTAHVNESDRRKREQKIVMHPNEARYEANLPKGLRRLSNRAQYIIYFVLLLAAIASLTAAVSLYSRSRWTFDEALEDESLDEEAGTVFRHQSVDEAADLLVNASAPCIDCVVGVAAAKGGHRPLSKRGRRRAPAKTASSTPLTLMSTS